MSLSRLMIHRRAGQRLLKGMSSAEGSAGAESVLKMGHCVLHLHDSRGQIGSDGCDLNASLGCTAPAGCQGRGDISDGKAICTLVQPKPPMRHWQQRYDETLVESRQVAANGSIDALACTSRMEGCKLGEAI